jgi:hypothetical protein
MNRSMLIGFTMIATLLAAAPASGQTVENRGIRTSVFFGVATPPPGVVFPSSEQIFSRHLL